MKKGLILIVALVWSCGSLLAQEQQANPMLQPIPNDPAMKIGKLDNGLTYYIMKNSKPENAANFHIVTHVGAVQETDAQNGLAHFLEHMAFNGISIFPNEKLLEYLQNNGIEFGRNINASTGFDVTQYFLQDIPLNKTKGLVDTALLILKDWSGNILLQDEEVDAERGVITEEHKVTQVGARKLSTNRFNGAGKGTNYAIRNVIGPLENLQKFKYNEIREFYETWYHTGLQAIVIVGDFDVAEMEAQVKEVFNTIPARENPKVKEKVIIPEYEETYAKIYIDDELTGSDFWAMAQIDEEQFETNNQYGSELRRYMFFIINDAINKRLHKLSQDPTSAIINAYHFNASMMENNEMEVGIAQLKQGKELEGIELLAREINRMKKYGINSTELGLTVQGLIKSSETHYNNRNDRTNTEIAQKAVDNFTTNIPIIQPEMDYQLAMQLLPTLTKDIVNQYVGLLIKEKNYFLSLGAPKTNITEAQIIEAFNKGLAADVKPVEERKVDSNILDSKTLTSGSIIETVDGDYDSEIITLSNGATIIFKKTELQKDQLIFSATKAGGFSKFEDNEYMAAYMANIFISSGTGGVGKYSSIDLSDALASKNANVSIDISTNSVNVKGASSSSDVETLFKLINLSLTQPRFVDNDIKTLQSQYDAKLKNWKNDPTMVFSNAIKVATAKTSLSRVATAEAVLNNIDLMSVENCKAVFEKAFDGVDGMTFTFVGNADIENIKKYAELYIGSIKAGEKTKAIKRNIKIKEDTSIAFTQKQADDKASVYTIIEIKGNNNYRDQMVFSMLGDVLDYKLTEVIREKMGATYGVGTIILSSPKSPSGYTRTFIATYSTTDKHVKASSAEIVNQIRIIAESGPAHEDFLKSVEKRKKNYVNDQINNSFWLETLNSLYNNDKETFNSFSAIINSITEKDIQKAAQSILKGKETNVIMTSEEL